jgi:hypothetical protein
MATNDQNESGLPLSNADNRDSANLLPRFFRTDSNKKFLQATLDQLTQPGAVKKVNGYIGRQTAKAVTSDDIFVKAVDTTRQNYQLEPAAVIRDFLGNTNFYKDYIDHINHVDVLGGNVLNHERINSQESYSWNPHINWDKFVNYQQYYWLPYGPSPIEITGQQLDIESTYTVDAVDESDNYAFLFSPDGLTRNPTLTLYRGQTYTFVINSPGNPFSIKTARVAGALDRYTIGVSNSAVESGTITFTVGVNSPDVLYYVSENSVDTGGVFHVLDIDENTYLNVDADILGKKSYTMSNGIPLSNGMKLKFEGNIFPINYATGYWYVEGVGTAIRLVSEADLEIISTYSQEKALLFDDDPFDQSPFSTATSFPQLKDYILIARGTPDRNPWSRYNRWFHQDVIIAAAEAAGQVPSLDQSARAIRPIIEFDAGLKLFNFGHQAKANVTLVDTFTTDVFSTVEGQLGYNIDGVDLANGMRVLFTADTDSLVNGRIFNVNFVNVTVPGRQIGFYALSGVDPDTNIITIETNTLTNAVGHGLTTGNQILYLNNGNADISGLINRKAYYVLVLNTTQIKLYTDKNLTVVADIFATGSAVHKLEVFSGFRRQINLVEADDSIPLVNETVLVEQGIINQGLMYWYTGTTWKTGQAKTLVNQPPMFDVFSDTSNSYGNALVYDGTTFVGTKLFSYKVGTGTNDTELGFPLSYQNINNIGDIAFEFNLLSDTFKYKNVVDIITQPTDVGFLKSISNLTSFNYVNGWTTTLIKNLQPIIRIFKESGLVNNFPVDVYSNIDDLTDLEVRVYINGKRQSRSNYTIVENSVRKYILLATDVALTDVVTLKCFSAQQKNENGYYEIPVNLQNNPLNNNLSEFTLGQVIDHVDTIIDNINTFTGTYPGTSNLRDIGNITAYGTRFIQHAGPVNLSLYHLGAPTANVFKALEQARDDYSKFKRAFIVTASSSGIDTDPRRHVDHVLAELAKDKSTSRPYYLSDMFGYAASSIFEYTVLDARTKIYPLNTAFNLTTLSNKAVNFYLNDVQMVEGRDYVFGTDVFFEILTDLTDGDIIMAVEYESTDGSFCPATPTKLGLYPKFIPSKFVDTTYAEPIEVIQGHDGSITIAFGDYRDDLILELEKRIFNNIKVQYNPDIFNIHDYIPGYNRPTVYSKDEYESILGTFFYQWTSNVGQDFTKQNVEWWDRLDPFTFNYRGNYSPDGYPVPAYWRGIYRWLLDTDRPHTHPWECLGFSLPPVWWQEVYGPVPYTSDNLIMWDDIRQGIVREPGQPVRRLEKFAKSILAQGVPVDENGDLQDPINANFVNGPIKPTSEGYYTFGDVGPVESAWRRSGHYPFAIIQAALLMQPNQVLGTCLDRSRIVRNLSNQLVYSDTGLRIRLADIILPSTALSTQRVSTSGLINYIIDYLTNDTTVLISQYQTDLDTLTNNLGVKLGGFTAKNKFRLLLDSKSPTSTGSIFIPEENYTVFLNTSSAVKKVVYSGVVITKHADGFEITGYYNEQPYFNYYPWLESARTINVGGISESYIIWTADKRYVAGGIVSYNNRYYRVNITHTSTDTFDATLFSRLADLPVSGGRDANIRKSWDTTLPLTLSYGTKLATVQEVVDFLQGYGAYLSNQGFVFDDFNTTLRAITNWETAVKEFMFWTTQNWGDGAVLSLSPAANRITISTTNSVVNDLLDPFYGYKIFRVDGQKLEPEFTNTYRNDDENSFSLTPVSTTHGIYGAVFYMVQKEHVMILDNRTLFNDVIYDLEPGYRQERIKVIGYLSQSWKGGFNIPGFIFDQARIYDWTPWTDYKLGDIVKYKEFYYSALSTLPGVQQFNDADWALLTEKPTPKMSPNWDYRAEQFTDFYDLDTDNFDAEQQKFAQHLIGYQKRQYLENIIKDDVSQYKFYQGMIIEKGTQNVLNKLFDVLSADGMESLTFNEEWAVRVGSYGAVTAFDETEFILDESQFKINPQPVELVSTIDSTVVDFVYRQRPSDVYIKPLGYNNDIWSVTGTKQYLRTPGFVRYEDVLLSVDTLNDVLTADITTFTEGDYVWCAFENKLNSFKEKWNVYRFTQSDLVVEAASYVNGVLTITCDKIPNLVAGDILGITNFDIPKDGFYTVYAVGNDPTDNKKIFIKTTKTGWEPLVDPTVVLLHQLVPCLFDTVDNVNDNLPTSITPGELVWTKDSGNGTWGVYENNAVYNSFNIDFATIPDLTGLNFGKKVTVSQAGTTAIVTDADQVIILERQNISATYSETPTTQLYKWIQTDSLVIDPSIADITNQEFGAETALSVDGKWLAIAAPSASNVDGSGYDNQGYVSLYYKAAGNRYTFVNYVESQTPAADELFGSKIAFGTSLPIVTTSTLTIDAGIQTTTITVTTYYMAVTATDAVYTYKNAMSRTVTTVNNLNAVILDSATGWIPVGTALTEGAGDEFGHSISMSSNGETLVVSAPGADLEAGTVYVYQLDNGEYSLTATLDDSIASDRFGESISISANGALLAVGSDTGNVYIYNTDNTSEPYQTITSLTRDISDQFGTTVQFTNNDTTLIVFATGADRVDIYDLYGTKFLYGESVTSTAVSYGASIAAGNNTILVGAPNFNSSAGAVFSYVKSPLAKSWTLKVYEQPRPNISSVKKSYLYNKVTNTIVTYLDVVDPIQGKIPGPADQEIRYKTYFDPATYSVGTSSVNVDSGLNWTTAQVGMLWWNLTRAKFMDNQGGEVVYRSTTWNKLYKTASIDIYEWVETKYLPSEWDKLADTTKGLAAGISGTSLYGDTVYSVKNKYDTVGQKLIPTYYFWVKNKKITPNAAGRILSAEKISSLISDPIGYGYACVAPTGANSFSLVNFANLLEGTDVVLNFQTWLIDNRDINMHSQWKIISEHPNTTIPKNIENKWIDSLIGKDSNDRVIPDTNLPVKNRYGIEFRPRQGMFVNRVEALKQYIERINAILLENLIVDDFDISDLMLSDPAPSTVSGLWDTVIDFDTELRFIGTATLVQATLTAVTENGFITDILIDNPGYGYKNPPLIKIVSSGIGAVLLPVLDTAGRIINVTIQNAGRGYFNNTMLIVRPYSVLVSSDASSFDKWSIYEWTARDKVWNRIRSQSYDVTKFWTYADWYATGYTQFTKIDYLVDNTYYLVTLSANIGSIVKVKNIGTGGWLLLEKYDNLTTIDYTQNYKVVGRQNGTIQFTSSIYTFVNSSVGFDNQLFDAALYDNYAATELRIIINSIKDKILVDDLRVEYLKLFFSSLRYVMHEQIFIDWAFKTSFVKATHNVGELKEKVTYNNDNLSNFEDYINEVKPYRTKIREYVSSYNKTDYARQSTTDFDLIPLVTENLTVIPMNVTITDTGAIDASSSNILAYPWKHWYDHVGFTIQSIEIFNGGNGYINQPVVRIEGGFGTGASAKAYISNGRVNRIDLISGGTRYFKAPTITLDGGLSETGTAATAIAIIESEVVRANKIAIKFDRITRDYYISEKTETETLVGTGSRVQFALKWSPRIQIGSASIKLYPAGINPDTPGVTGIDILRGEYTLATKKSTSKGYTSYSGLLTLDTAPAVGETIRITYEKNFEHMSAADRINFFYEPTSGMLGKDLAQLMNGIDYSGVQLQGLGFGATGGWDALPWFTDEWDGFDPTYDDRIFTAGAGDFTYDLQYAPNVGELINVYISRYNPTSTVNINSVTVSPLDNNSVWITTSIAHGFTAAMFVNIAGVTTGNYDGTYRIRQIISEDTFSITIDRAVVLGTGGTVLGYTYANPIRIDDPNFVSYPLVDNPYVVMASIIGDGTTEIFTLVAPNLAINDKDKVIFRKSTSDGSILPRPNNYDTQLQGGAFDGLTLTTATGYAPADINIDGDDFVTPATSHAPEEIVPGHITDALAIKVYHRVEGGAPNILFKNYIGNGVNDTFIIGQYFATNRAVIVKVGNVIFEQTAYTIDWASNSVIFDIAPAANSVISIISIGFNSENILDLDHFVADGTTTEYVTRAPWIEGELTSTVLVNGIVPTYELFRTDNTYDSPDRVAIRFSSSVEADSLINYMIDTGTTVQTASVVKSQIITTDGTVTVYDLDNLNSEVLPGNKLQPYETNVIVRKGQEILRPSTVLYFTMADNVLSYTIPAHKFATYSISSTDIRVYADSNLLSPGAGYIVDLFGITIELSQSSYIDGAKLAVVVDVDFDYIITDEGTIEFATVYPEDTNIEVISFYNHMVLDIDRTTDIMTPSTALIPGTTDYYEFTNKLGGYFTLRRPAVSDDFVWIIKNGTLLTHSVDYTVEDDRVSVKLKESLEDTDVVQVMSFSDQTVRSTFGFMQFKDMLNRVHYKRLRAEKTSVLAANLTQSDIEITVVDGSVFSLPNPALNLPGIIEIHGERIEYFTKVGNVLGQLRRGTLGTGTPAVHLAGQTVQDIGSTETIPYADNIIIDTVISNGVTTDLGNLSYTPLDVNEIDVFVGGYKLKKVDYDLFEETNGYPYSTEGDSTFPAEFSVDGIAKGITLTTAAAEGTEVVIVKKELTLWNDPGKSLANSNNKIANFLKENTTVWPR